jgi:pyruvate-formate lyase-activating enzyme
MAKKVKKTVETPFGKVPLSKKEVKVIADNVKTSVITNVYSPNFNLIDDTVEEIKKSIRKNGVDHYSCNNIYIILQDALKKVTLSGN